MIPNDCGRPISPARDCDHGGGERLPAWDGGYSAEKATDLKEYSFDRKALGARGLPYERLDQLTIDLLLGTR